MEEFHTVTRWTRASSDRSQWAERHLSSQWTMKAVLAHMLVCKLRLTVPSLNDSLAAAFDDTRWSLGRSFSTGFCRLLKPQNAATKYLNKIFDLSIMRVSGLFVARRTNKTTLDVDEYFTPLLRALSPREGPNSQ